VRVPLWVWCFFGVLVLAMLAIDFGLDSRERQRPTTLGAAASRSVAWIVVSLLFGLIVLAVFGTGPTVTYYTAYLLEKSLSVDNLFVFALIFSELAIPDVYQHRVLLYGVLGALVMRGIMIAGGVYLIDRFHWVLYAFAALLLLAATRLLFGEKTERRAVVKACAVCDSWVARFVPVTPVISNGKFWRRQNGRLMATPLLIALIVIETSDLVFALDSIPAVLAVTQEPFLVYTSNVFAILGLRSLYFLVAGAIQRFHALRYALAAILAFVGAKLLLSDVLEIPNWASLAVVIGAVIVAIAVSRWTGNRERGTVRPPSPVPRSPSH